MEIRMKSEQVDTVPLQLLTIQTQNGERWIFVGSPAVMPTDTDASNAIVDVWFSNIQDVPKDASIRSLVEMMDKQNIPKEAVPIIHPPGSDTLQ